MEKSSTYRVENTVGKGQIAHYKQFLLFLKCSQDLNCKHIKTASCLGKGGLLTTLRERPFENIVEKEENAGKQHFLLFTQCFLLFTKQILTLDSDSFCHLQMLSVWDGPKFCRLVKG